MSEPIKFMCSEEDPPTILFDIVDLPDPVKIGLSVRVYNYDDETLYFTITGSAVGWTFASVDLGALGSGTNKYFNLDDFGQRAKPVDELDEIVSLTLKAYTDAEYTNLKHTYDKDVGIKWIKSDDISYTVDFLDNFDDGTVQGWAVEQTQGTPLGGYPQLTVDVSYVLSPEYSLRMTMQSGTTTQGAKIYKQFSTPDKDVIYAIINTRTNKGAEHHKHMNEQVWSNGTVLLFIGRPKGSPYVDVIPLSKWTRKVVTLPRNALVTVAINWDRYDIATQQTPYSRHYMDDFKIISK